MIDLRNEIITLTEKCIHSFVMMRMKVLNMKNDWRKHLEVFVGKEYFKYPANYEFLHNFFTTHSVEKLDIRSLDLTAIVPLLIYFPDFAVLYSDGFDSNVEYAFKNRFHDFKNCRNALKHYTEEIQETEKDSFIIDQMEAIACIIRFTLLVEKNFPSNEVWKEMLNQALYFQTRLRQEKWFLVGDLKSADIDPESDISDLEYYADSGNASAQLILGKLLFRGKRFGLDREKAFMWFYKAAKSGSPEAMYWVGKCYKSALGVDYDNEKGMEWIKKSADFGCSVAQYSWGIRNYAKNGITDNEIQDMIHWLKLSADQKYPEALWSLGLCYEIGYGVVKNVERASELKEEAALLGSRFAGEQLAEVARKNGDNETAEKWYGIALKYGSETAKKALERYRNRGRF